MMETATARWRVCSWIRAIHTILHRVRAVLSPASRLRRQGEGNGGPACTNLQKGQRLSFQARYGEDLHSPGGLSWRMRGGVRFVIYRCPCLHRHKQRKRRQQWCIKWQRMEEKGLQDILPPLCMRPRVCWGPPPLNHKDSINYRDDGEDIAWEPE